MDFTHVNYSQLELRRAMHASNCRRRLLVSRKTLGAYYVLKLQTLGHRALCCPVPFISFSNL